MDATPASQENGDHSIEKLEALVTPEQVHSASVAKKRRTITRKRSSSDHKNRSQTPLRPTLSETTSSDDETKAAVEEKVTQDANSNVDGKEEHVESRETKIQAEDSKSEEKETKLEAEEIKETKPEAPERIRKPASRNVSLKETKSENKNSNINNENKKELLTKINNDDASSIKMKVYSASNSDQQSIRSEILDKRERSSSLPRQLEEKMHQLDNFVQTNKQELINMFHKAKSTVEEKGKEIRKRRLAKTNQKRSQSTPKSLTKEELLESFQIAEKQTNLRSKSAQRFVNESEAEPKRPSRKSNLIIPPKKLLKHKVKSNKIVEVLDPKSYQVMEVKEVGEVTHMKFTDSFKIFKFYSLREICKEYKKYKQVMNEEYTLIRKQRRQCINHLILLLIFCGIGGIIFKFVEGSFENFYKCGVKRVKRDFIDLLWMKSHNLREDEWKSLARIKLRNFEDELHNAHEAGIHSYSGQKSWSFLNGIVYCLTVVTTIGYGHLYPTTTTGRALTIVYSLIGIPLFLIILTDFGKLFTRCIKFLWSFVRRLYYTGSCRQIRKTARTDEIFKGAQMMYEIATFRRPSMFVDPNSMQQSSPQSSGEGATAPPTPAISNYEIDDEFNLPISVAILLLVLYIFLGAVLFAIWEGWDFFASFYFVFISMSTIGFGDYVPRHPVFMIVSIVYLVFGLALMSMCINVVQVKLSDTFSQASAKIGATIGLGVATDDGSIQTVPPKSVEIPAVHVHLGSKQDLTTPLNTPET